MTDNFPDQAKADLHAMRHSEFDREDRRTIALCAAIARLADVVQPNAKADTFGIDDLLQTRADLARLHKCANTFLKKQTAVNFSELSSLLTELAVKY